MKYEKLNSDDSMFLSMTVVLSSVAFGFMLACVMDKPIENHSLSKRVVEPIPVEKEAVEVEYYEELITEPIKIADDQKILVNALDTYSEYELSLMAKVVHAEAGNQDEIGKRLIADVILNRLDSDAFPDTVEEVVWQENQFAMHELYTIDDLNAVKDEIQNRTDNQVLFFRKNHYHSIGNPAYQHGDHYFSTM